ncbi:hypothetical protein [Nostoc sp.]|uniref:hypothetical protein n=1 Tax=Nostoc sp. TaxID=1180 RepID=UPI002FF5E8A9
MGIAKRIGLRSLLLHCLQLLTQKSLNQSLVCLRLPLPQQGFGFFEPFDGTINNAKDFLY